MTRLVFVLEVGKLGGDNLGNLEVVCGCEVHTKLYRGIFIMKTRIRRYFILHVTTLGTWHNKNCHSTGFHWQI
jgi:hypothetical protein